MAADVCALIAMEDPIVPKDASAPKRESSESIHILNIFNPRPQYIEVMEPTVTYFVPGV